FLVSGLLERLVYLSAGLAVVLAFIGLKLIGQALWAYGIDHLGPVPVPEVSAGVSLAVIAGILLVTIVSSLAATRRTTDQDGAGDRAGQARRPGQGARPGRGGRVDEEGRAPAEHRQVLPWAGPAPSIGRNGWRLVARSPARRGRQGVPDMRQDVP
ncbi:MAG TPA: hypothetical protein VGF54_12425, partial [Streptosporangiaceae bacterium]